MKSKNVDDSDKRTAAAIEKFRQEHGLYQREMAKLLGIIQPHYSNIVHHNEKVGLRVIRAAYKLGIPAEELLGGAK